jgi:O-acetyl-ADP-ribose deacetylase (regulator of RNase III)
MTTGSQLEPIAFQRHETLPGLPPGSEEESEVVKTLSGDLIHLAKTGEFGLIVRGCNCFCTMGAGIAKGIKAAFPVAFEADLATARGDRAKLGTCTFAEIDRNGTPLVVVNAYTEFDYRGSGLKVNYEAVRFCFRWIKQKHSSKTIGFPKIGAELAGGDWTVIVAIVGEERHEEDYTIVEFLG